MLQYVGDSFPDEICYLNPGDSRSLLVHFPVYMRGAHYSSSDKPKDLGVAYKTRGPCNGERYFESIQGNAICT